MFWIPAHVGLEGNERADVLAKEGTTTLPVGPGPMLPVSIAVINERIETYLANLHKKRWLDTLGCRQAKEALGAGLQSSNAKMSLGLKREDFSNMASVLTGHCRLNRHLNLLGIVDSSVCGHCNEEEETPGHYLGRCPIFAAQRKRFMGNTILRADEIWRQPWIKMAYYIKATGRLKLETQDKGRR